MEHTTIAVDLAKSVFQVAVSHRPAGSMKNGGSRAIDSSRSSHNTRRRRSFSKRAGPRTIGRAAPTLWACPCDTRYVSCSSTRRREGRSGSAPRRAGRSDAPHLGAHPEVAPSRRLQRTRSRAPPPVQRVGPPRYQTGAPVDRCGLPPRDRRWPRSVPAQYVQPRTAVSRIPCRGHFGPKRPV